MLRPINRPFDRFLISTTINRNVHVRHWLVWSDPTLCLLSCLLLTSTSYLLLLTLFPHLTPAFTVAEMMRSFSKRLPITLLALSLFLQATVYAATPQSCYYDVNKLASDDIIPCYSSKYESQYSCCKVGNKCLRHNACFDIDNEVTYQYGCTDPTMQHPNCPKKCNLDTNKSRWVGLVFCNGTDNLPSNEWLCHHPDNCGGRPGCGTHVWDSMIERLPPTGCENLKQDDKYVAFHESWTLSDIAALPVKTETASWWSEHADRWSTTSTTVTVASSRLASSSSVTSTSTSATASTTATTTSMTTSTPTSTDSSDPRPTTEASKHKSTAIGLGVGLGVGVPFVLCMFGVAFFYMRRQSKFSRAQQANRGANTPDEKTVAAAYGGKPELDGTPVCESYGSPQPSELQGSSATATPYVSPAMVQGEFAGTKSPFVTPEHLQGSFTGAEGRGGHRGGGERWDDIHEMGV